MSGQQPPIWTEPWVAQAECAKMDVDLWFPERGESSREARAVCRECPVRVECLEYALRWNERYGIWGGTSGRERRKMRAERNKGVRG